MKKIVLGAAAIATLLAAYFAPDDENSVVAPAAATTRAAPAAAPQALATALARPAGIDLAIHPRREDEDDLGNLFAKQSWQSEAPKKVLSQQLAQPGGAAPSNANAGAPPLPFRFLGRFVDDGKTAYFLQVDGRNVVARVGEKIDDNYLFDNAAGDTLSFTYLPLKQKQSLVVGDLN
ncbi:hypothetical protein [Janthinobacterium agaricidamnosum]|uniref:Prolin-rich transmembrane protein n=1 Tax=Janthinobacterium agaricidamnosum NBRC 102515 = DSM 9628 TaxID=1349767 RepID=W0V1V1_9BURK|nr:hypothetical protein [Janthinobacterium agaricidamnosum]CDG81313.1 hypothetical protein GJA_654 [Janthinobacterium agaricidamnosum NBRC 102515 = DSM 9628]